MKPTHEFGGARPARAADFEQVLDHFDQAWRGPTPPTIQAFAASWRAEPGNDPSGHRRLLEELVKIDLEYRWQRQMRLEADAGPAGGPMLEDYVRCYPELGPCQQLSPALIGSEYRARQLWGCHPNHQEYFRRFPRQQSKLLAFLHAVDAELAAEFSRGPQVTPDGDRSAAADTPVPITSVADLLAALKHLPLLSSAQLSKLRNSHRQFTDSRMLARELLQRGWLTPFQVNLLLLGRGPELIVGPYVLLERLGEGGTGQVFKARHQRMERIAALKLIRKELLADPEVVQRFYREVAVTSQLDHPNIVHAYDAGPIATPLPLEGQRGVRGHFLAMAYVEGIDLSRLVKQAGPLPVLQACEFICQAACGLSHAHQRGLVHRDIKPSNLLLAGLPSHGGGLGTVKILDFGLARLQRNPVDGLAPEAAGADDRTQTLTPPSGVMMGTPDYVSPEQALDFHQADIRADIYSLGCTFFYLLTGRPPFDGGTVVQKLWKHQQAPPPPLERFRTDVPPGPAQALHKMLAKRPEDRYQTPAEVVAALAGFDGGLPTPIQAASPRRRFLQRGAAGLVLASGAAIAWRLLGPADPKNAPATRGDHRWQYDAPVRRLVFSPDSNLVYSAGDDDIVFAQNRTSGERQAAIHLRDKERMPNPNCQSLALDGKTVAAGMAARGEGIAKIWNLATKEEVKTLQGHSVISNFRIIALSPEGKALASAGGTGGRTVKLVNLTTGRYSSPSLEPGVGTVLAFAFSADSKVLAVAGEDRLIMLFDLTLDAKQTSLAAERLSLKGHAGAVRAVAFSPNGRTLASGGADKTVRLWDSATGKLLLTLEPADVGTINAVAFSPDNRMLAAAGADRQIRLWDVASGRLVRGAWEAHTQAVLALAFAPDGSCLASGGEDRNLCLWQLPRE
jgi:serine/threonine protein kinase